jgi:hypothetical protein
MEQLHKTTRVAGCDYRHWCVIWMQGWDVQSNSFKCIKRKEKKTYICNKRIKSSWYEGDIRRPAENYCSVLFCSEWIIVDQALLSSKRRPHFKIYKWFWNYDHGSRRGPKPIMTVLAKTSSKLLLFSVLKMYRCFVIHHQGPDKKTSCIMPPPRPPAWVEF